MEQTIAATAYKNYINGEWIESNEGRTFKQLNPARLNQVTGIWPAMSKAETSRAIEAAQQAFPKWRSLSVYNRAGYLKQALQNMIDGIEEIAEIITLENGKTLTESKTEIKSAIKEMEYQIHEGLRLCGQTLPSAREDIFCYSTYQPLGPVSIISPWNFPFNVPGRKITPALMAGNTVVFKPATLTPLTGYKFVELFVKAGLPAGVLNFVTGSGSSVGEVMVTDPRIKAISFTGSTQVGTGIHQKAAQVLTRTQLEMGGKNPVVVLEDCDLEEAANATVTAAYACAGQWCTSTSRAIVVKPVAGEFIRLVKEKAEKIKVGDGMQPDTQMGPVCGTAQLKSILKYIEIGHDEGAELLTGGYQVKDGALADGCFIAPTIFSGVKPHMKIAREEIFGPVLSIIEVEDFQEAVQVSNEVEYGLCSSVFTKNLEKAMQFIEQTEVGLTHVNLITALKEPQYTFGGIKNSGVGIPEAGKTGIEFFTEHKVAYIKFK